MKRVKMFLKPSLLAIYTCFFISFALGGCSSLHVDISPSVDWNTVKVIEFQSPPQDPWQLTQPIKSELSAMGFQVKEGSPDPDLLFSYFTQESPDLTVESEVITRLKSLHVQFIDPTTKTLVTAIDYFYPEVTSPSAPAMGVKEVFLGLQQQIQTEINSQSVAVKNLSLHPVPAKQVSTSPPAQTEKPQVKQLQSESTQNQNERTDSATNASQSKPVEKEELNQKTATTVLEKPDKKSRQAVQQTSSPWIPKFKSWGFENWGQDSPDDY